MAQKPITEDRMSPEDADLHATARAVAIILGWEYEVPTEDEEEAGPRAYAHSARIYREDGLAIHLRRPHSPRGRIEISHSLQIPQGISWYGLITPSITVAADRDRVAMAREIERRLIPQLETFAAEIATRGAARDDWRNSSEESARLIEAAGAERVRFGHYGAGEREAPRLQAPLSATVAVQGSSATFERLSVPAVVAARIVEILRDEAARQAREEMEPAS